MVALLTVALEFIGDLFKLLENLGDSVEVVPVLL